MVKVHGSTSHEAVEIQTEVMTGSTIVSPSEQVVRYNARCIANGSVLSFSSVEARQSHIDCWPTWVIG